MRPELPWAVAEDKSVSIQPARSLFISWGKTVQTNGATSIGMKCNVGSVSIGHTSPLKIQFLKVDFLCHRSGKNDCQTTSYFLLLCVIGE